MNQIGKKLKVKYSNEINTFEMSAWTAPELNFFFAVVAKLKNQRDNLIVFTLEELKEMTGYNQSDVQLLACLINVQDNMGRLRCYRKYQNMLESIPAFMKLAVPDPEKVLDDEGNLKESVVVTAQVHPEAIKYFNNFTQGCFTEFELQEFVSLKRFYSKQLYRQIKQYRLKGVRDIPIEEFRNIIGVPQKYKSFDIERRIIEPAIEEISEKTTFKKLRFEKRFIGSSHKVGGYTFRWKPEKPPEQKKKKSKKPTEEELAKYIKDNNLIGLTAKQFISYYDNKGWNGVNNWQAVATYWSESTRAKMEMTRNTPMPDWYYQQEQTPVDTETLISIIAIQFDFDEDTPEYDEFIKALHKLNDETGDLANDRIAEIAAEIRQKYSA